MAVYGDVASEVVPLSPEYHPLPLPVVDPVQLHPALDPANMHDHTLLAQQLLESVPKAPPLALAIRLIFCLKPTSTDWDDPEFPCLYASPDNGKPDMDVDECYQLSKRPVSEDATSESVQDFTSSFAARMVNDVQVRCRLHMLLRCELLSHDYRITSAHMQQLVYCATAAVNTSA